jgi:hypothetical protein
MNRESFKKTLISKEYFNQQTGEVRSSLICEK